MLQAVIDGRIATRTEILAWEDKRTAAVRRTLKMAPSSESREQQRMEVLERKLDLGHDGLRALLRRGLWWSEKISRLSVVAAGRRRRYSVCELRVSRGSAEQFAGWFMDRNAANDERVMLDACPDHYVITHDEQGRQLVLETTGGSPFPAEFAVDYDDVSSLHTAPDPAYPHQLAGVARLADGFVIGGVRHQFRQEGEGFRALLTVEFPATMPKRMIAQHRWHLAAEWANWIEAAPTT